MQCRGFDPPLRRIFPVEGIFPLELSWLLTPFPPNSFGREYKLRSSLCIHAFNCTDSKDCAQVPFTKMECDFLNSWIKKWSHAKNLTQNGEPQRSSWGTQQKTKKKNQQLSFLTNSATLQLLFQFISRKVHITFNVLHLHLTAVLDAEHEWLQHKGHHDVHHHLARKTLTANHW